MGPLYEGNRPLRNPVVPRIYPRIYPKARIASDLDLVWRGLTVPLPSAGRFSWPG